MNKLIYIIIKDNKYVNHDIDKFKKLDGFYLTKEKVKKIKGTSLNNIMIINSFFIETVITRKLERKLKYLLELLANICESDDSDGAIKLSLNEIEKFKRIVQNEYYEYMKKKQIDIINKKIRLLEEEFKNKIYQYKKNSIISNFQYELKDNEDERKSSRRR